MQITHGLTNRNIYAIQKLKEIQMITLAGYGFVGQAHHRALKDTFEVTVYDPALGYNDFGSPQGVIVCVSTPAHANGACNVNHVAEVLELTSTDIPVLIRSTVSVEGWRALRELYPDHKLAFAPEFLRAAHAVEDFANTRHIYIGGADIGFWHAVFRVAFDDPTFTTEVVDAESLILAKYFRNSYLATRVAFFNQVYDLCAATGTDYNTVRHVVAADPRIGPSHTEVTAERGFGGHCFPKDIAAILHTADLHDVDLSLIKQAVEYNKSVRKMS
jgi:UDPglucose 6-dehydrogenase